MMKRIFLAVTFLFAPMAWAEETPTTQPFYIGSLLGASFLNEGRGTQFSYGARAGIQIDPQILIGAYYDRYRVISTPIADSYANFLMGEAHFYPDRVGSGFFMGGKLGVGIVQSDRIGGYNDSDTDFAVAPSAGFEMPLNEDDRFILGVEGNYSFIPQANGLASFNLLGTFRFVFDGI